MIWNEWKRWNFPVTISHNWTSSFRCRQSTFQASKLLPPATECAKVMFSVVSVCSHVVPHVITTTDDIGQSQVTWTPSDLFKPVHFGPPPALVPPCCTHTGIPSSRLAFDWKALLLLVIMHRSYFKTFSWNAWNDESFVIYVTLWSLNTHVWQTVIGQRCHHLVLANLLCTSFAHLMGMVIMLNCDLLSFIIT